MGGVPFTLSLTNKMSDGFVSIAFAIATYEDGSTFDPMEVSKWSVKYY